MGVQEGELWGPTFPEGREEVGLGQARSQAVTVSKEARAAPEVSVRGGDLSELG